MYVIKEIWRAREMWRARNTLLPSRATIKWGEALSDYSTSFFVESGLVVLLNTTVFILVVCSRLHPRVNSGKRKRGG